MEVTVRTRPGHEQMEWITDLREADEILKSKQFRNTLHDGPARWVIGDSLGTLWGDEHTYRRRTEILIFSRPALMSYELELIRPALHEALAGPDAAGEPSAAVRIPIQPMMRSALLRISARIVGLDLAGPEDTDALRSIAERIGEGTAAEWLTEGQDEAVRRSIEAREEFRRRFFVPARDRRAALVARVRSGKLDAAELSNDLLTLLLKAYDSWAEDQMLRECIFYLGASASTTSQAAPHVLFEILSWIEQHPEDAGTLRDISFLRDAVHETLRLHPPAPALMRAPLEDVVLASGRVMRAGINVALDLNAVNRDTTVFGPDAAEFNPHRMPPKGMQGYGESFGAGTHVCPGRLIAAGTAVAVGDSENTTVGVLVRLMEELFRYYVRLDPTDPPTGRADTMVDRYDSFNVLVSHRKSVGA